MTSSQTEPVTSLPDKNLRSRVRLFGNLLGEVLREQSGEGVFHAVEALRKGYIRLRMEKNDKLRKRLSRLIENLTPNELTCVIRAFNLYFSLVNIAEESFQHHYRRQLVRKGGPLWLGSFSATMQELHDEGIEPQQIQTLLNEALYMPVFTAHPTEAIRRTIMRALRRLFITSEKLDDRRISRDEREAIRQEIKLQIQVLWKTDEVRVNMPSVEDEIRNGLYFFHESLFEAVPVTYRYLEKAIQRVYQTDDMAVPITVPGGLIHFGSWIGGDRDGNPFVKPATTALALRMQMREILGIYISRIRELSPRLTHSSLLYRFPEAFLENVQADELRFPEAIQGLPADYVHEYYRHKLRIMQYRLNLNLAVVEARIENPETDPDPQATGYANEQELLEDLQLISDALVAGGDSGLANADLKDLIRLVQTFGFFLMHLDIRQESTRHTEAISEIFKTLPGEIDYASLDEAARQQQLTQPLESIPPVLDRSSLSDDTLETLEVFDVMRTMQSEVIRQLRHLDDAFRQPYS